jgi:hypothetical protein
MAERKLRFDTAETAAVPRPRGGMLDQDRTHAAQSYDPAASPETSDALTSSGNAVDEPRLTAPQPVEQTDFGVDSKHDLARRVQQKLNSQPALKFQSLVVRQIEGGICLEGVLESNDSLPDVKRLVRSVANVDRILNRLTVRLPDKPPD